MKVVILTQDCGDNAPNEFVGVFDSFESLKNYAKKNKDELFISDSDYNSFIENITIVIDEVLEFGSSNYSYFFELKNVISKD